MIDSTIVEASEADVRRFKALGDPTRLRILHVLAGGGRCVCEIQPRVDVAANLLSHHLKVLRHAGLVVSERRGRWIHYQLDETGLAAVANALPASSVAATVPDCACGGPRVPA